MECEPQQALLQELELDIARDIQERLLKQLAVLHDPDLATSLGDEQAPRTVIRRGYVDWLGQAVGDLDELDLRIARQVTARLGGFGRMENLLAGLVSGGG